MRIFSVYRNKLLFLLYILNKRRKLAFSVALIILVELMIVYLGFKNVAANGHLIIVSTTYYHKSSFYSSDTAVILFNAEYTIEMNQKWQCVTKDINGKTFISTTTPRFAYPVVPNCAWTTLIANCTTVKNPVNFQLSVENKAVNLQLRPAVTERLPVVACFSPLFFNERWQLSAISIESYAASGVSKQAYYVMSALKDVYDLLQFYEKEKIIDINLWHLPKHPEARIQLDWRNQGAAHLDCYLKYREAAEFIIISDIDDLLFPKREYNFFNDLKFYSSIYPNASSFFYPRFDSEITAAKTFKNFNIRSSLESIKISNKLVTGKSVHKTSLVETVWLHWAGLTKHKKYYKKMDMAENIFVHIRNWDFINKHLNNSILPKTMSNMEANYLFPNLTTVAPVNFISTMTKKFDARFRDYSNAHHLKSSDIYYDKINECYDEMQLAIRKYYVNHTEPPNLCPTPARCKFFPISNISCAVTSSYYRTTKFSDKFSVDTAILPSKISIRYNGCKIN